MLDGLAHLALTVANVDTGGPPGVDWLRYAMACVGILSLLGLAAIGLKRVSGTSWAQRATRRSLRVVDVLSVGRKQRLVVVNCYDRSFVLGVGEKEVSLVAELDAEQVQAPAPVPETVVAPQPAPSAEPGRFSELLARIGAELGPEVTSAAAARVRAREGAGQPADASDPAEAERRTQREIVRRAAARAAAAEGTSSTPIDLSAGVDGPAPARPRATVADALRNGGLLG